MDTVSDRIAVAKGERRTLVFATIDDALAEGRRIAEMERAGTAKYIGNWTAGQILNHLGAWAEYPFDGYPIKVPWYVRMVTRFMKRRVLTKGFSPGVKLPNVPGGTLATEHVSVEVGLPRFLSAFQHLAVEPPERLNPLFGRLTQGEWIMLNLRHAELHMSFVR